MNAVVDSLLVTYKTIGKGPTVLLLHGWGSDSHVFDNMARQLAANFEVVTVDLPGFGGSQAPESAWDLSDYASFVASFIKKIRLNPHAVIAHSNGGAIAMKALATDKLKADKLIVLGGAGIRPKRNAKKLALKFIAKTGKIVTIALPKETKKKIRNVYYDKIGSHYRLVEGMEETFKKTVDEDILRIVPDVSIPVLLIYGENDTSTPPVYGRIFHELLPASQLEVVGGAGHFVFIDKPEATFSLITEFLA